MFSVLSVTGFIAVVNKKEVNRIIITMLIQLYTYIVLQKGQTSIFQGNFFIKFYYVSLCVTSGRMLCGSCNEALSMSYVT